MKSLYIKLYKDFRMLGFYIYLAGCIVSFIFTLLVAYIKLDDDYSIVKSIPAILLVSTLSWLSFIIICISYLVDKISLIAEDIDNEDSDIDDYYF